MNKPIFISLAESVKYFDINLNRKRCIKRYKYKCSCGNEFISRSAPSKNLQSCGCITKLVGERSFKHGFSKEYARHPLYAIWKAMRSRCYNNKGVDYKHYGGRGIKVCERWMDHDKGFLNFVEDMNNRPSKKHSLDRIDVNDDYCLKNCRWATSFQQNNNRRDNTIIEYNGIRKTIGEWSVITRIKKNTLIYRIKKGWKEIDIIEKPVREIHYVQISRD